MTILTFDIWSARTVATIMQPAMPAAELLAQWMSSPPQSTQAPAPFVPTFSPTPQHYPAAHPLPQSLQPQYATTAFTQSIAPTPQRQQQQQLLGHTVPQPMQAPFANSAFTQLPFMLSTHHITTQPCQAFSHHRITTQPYQIFSSHHHSMVTYQPTPQSTSTPLVQPLPATPVSQQFPTTTAPTPPLRYNKHSRTRSRTTRKKHRSTTSHLTPRQQYTPPTPPDTTKTTSAPQPTQAVELITFKKPSETSTTFVNYPCKHQFSHTWTTPSSKYLAALSAI